MKKSIYLSLVILLSFSAYSQESKTEKASPSKTVNSTDSKQDVLPETSIYQLNHQWKDQFNQPFKLVDLMGNPVVITMMFTHCEYACPMMVNDLKLIKSQLPKKHKDIKFVLISFDHLRDTANRLLEYAKTQGLDENWILLHGDAEQIKEISVVLDISYEQMENGSFAHSNKKLVLDKTGTVVFSIDGLQTDPYLVISALNKTW